MCACLDYTHTHKQHSRRGKKYLFDGNGMPIIVQVTACVFLGGFWCVVRAIAPKFVCRNDFEKIWIQFCVQTGAILPEGRKMGDAKSPTYCSALFESAEYPTCGQPFDMTSLTSVYPIMLFSSCVTLSYKFGIYPELFHSIKRTSRTNFGEPAIRINWID